MLPIIVLVGKSGSGKTTIEKELVKRFNWNKVISFTTRKPRDGEVDGIDYHFLNDYQFLQYENNNELVEKAEYRGWQYGIHRDEIIVGEYNIVVAEPHGFYQLKEKYGNRVMGVYIDATNSTRILRMLEREIESNNLKEVVKEIIRRFPNDEKDFEDIYNDIGYDVWNECEEDLDANIEYIYNIATLRS